MNDLVDALSRVKTRIATPATWTQNCAARDAQGRVRHYNNGDAVSWCLDSAVRMEAPRELRSEVARILERCVLGRDFIEWQDKPGRTHAQVIALLDRAIAVTEAKR